ncbi:MAG: hypothetical protein ACP5TY_07855 [Thermodesulforhabdaceae bacterium]
MDRKDLIETFFCDILDLKEKKAHLYAEWADKCYDSIGREALVMLRDAEKRDLERLQAAREELAKTNRWSDACRYIPERVPIADAVLSKAVRAYKESKGKHCGSVKIPFEVGMELEDKSIGLFRKFMETAQSDEEKKFIESFIAEEKEHFRTLADLKYFYEDPEGWFMEKGRQVLDGA